jgi:MFS transporter, ACS family, D-galactonate transporter
MSTPPAAARTKLSGSQWAVLLLLVISIFINYIDRGNLSIAGPLLMASPEKGGLGMDPARLGQLLSAFFWTYALFQLLGVVGFLLDRFDVAWVYAAAYLAWSAATAATGLANSFVVLFGLRLLLGMGESAAYPSYSKIFATHFPEHHRGMANSLIDAGSKFGPALGTLVGGLLMAQFGMAALLLRVGRGQPGLADSVVEVDAARTGYPDHARRAPAARSPAYPGAALRLGIFRRIVLRQLFLVFPA